MIKIYSAEEISVEDVLNRKIEDYAEYEGAVREIIARVRAEGDAALRYYGAKFDGYAPENLELTAEERAAACARVSDGYKAMLARAAKNIEEFHRRQLREGFEYRRADGVKLGVVVQVVSLCRAVAVGVQQAHIVVGIRAGVALDNALDAHAQQRMHAVHVLRVLRDARWVVAPVEPRVLVVAQQPLLGEVVDVYRSGVYGACVPLALIA